MSEQGGAFKKKKTNFSQISNVALTDPKLSLKAKGLYAVIQRYLTLSEFSDYIVYKSTIQGNCSEGKSAFDSTWKELKDAGYLIMEKKKTAKGLYVYEYELLDAPANTDDSSTPRFSVSGQSTSGESMSGKPISSKSVSLNKKEEKNKELKINQKEIIHSFKTTKKLLDLENTDFFEDEFEMRSYVKTLLATSDIEGMNEDIINSFSEGKNETPYTYNDFITFAANQVSLADTFHFSTLNEDLPANVKFSTAMDWIKAMANVYSDPNEFIYVGKNRYKAIDFKQRLLLIDKNTFQNILIKFARMSKESQIKNLASYMLQMLHNSNFDSGLNMSDQIDVNYFQ